MECSTNQSGLIRDRRHEKWSLLGRGLAHTETSNRISKTGAPCARSRYPDTIYCNCTSLSHAG